MDHITLPGRLTPATAAHQAATRARIEDYVFFRTICGMTTRQAAQRIGVDQDSAYRWHAYLRSCPPLARWHAAANRPWPHWPIPGPVFTAPPVGRVWAQYAPLPVAA